MGLCAGDLTDREIWCKKLLFLFSLLFYPLFSQKLSVSGSYKVVSYMQDSAVQITWLVAMVTKTSVATMTGNDFFGQKLSLYQNGSFCASE